MKRILAFLMSTVLLLSLTACGSNHPAQDNGNQTNDMEESNSSGENNGENNSGGIEVDEGLLSVEVTIPAEFLDEGTTQESLNQLAAESGYGSVVLNEDGSATYTMTKEQHEKLMAEIRSGIEEAMDEMFDSEEFPAITNVSANANYTEFTVELNSDEVGLTESFAVLGFYMLGGMYNAFNGTPADDITVLYVNADGDVIEEAHSSELGD